MGNSFVARIVADKSGGVEQYDAATRSATLVNPDGEAWPVKGLKLELAPTSPKPSMSWVAKMRDHGFATLEGERVVRQPGGPASNPNGLTHTFMCCERIEFRTIDGNIAYRVVRNPGKYVGDSDKRATADDVSKGVACRVDWFFVLEKENG